MQDTAAVPDAQEMRRLALQSTAEIWRGLDVLDLELRACQLSSARQTVRTMRELVKMADTFVIDIARTSARSVAPPRVVASPADLDELPQGSVIRDAREKVGEIWTVMGRSAIYWTAIECEDELANIALPAVAIFVPTDG
jgi:hypothetical protein